MGLHFGSWFETCEACGKSYVTYDYCECSDGIKKKKEDEISHEQRKLSLKKSELQDHIDCLERVKQKGLTEIGLEDEFMFQKNTQSVEAIKGENNMNNGETKFIDDKEITWAKIRENYPIIRDCFNKMADGIISIIEKEKIVFINDYLRTNIEHRTFLDVHMTRKIPVEIKFDNSILCYYPQSDKLLYHSEHYGNFDVTFKIKNGYVYNVSDVEQFIIKINKSIDMAIEEYVNQFK